MLHVAVRVLASFCAALPQFGALKCKFGEIKVNGPSEWQAAGEESLQWELTFIAVRRLSLLLQLASRFQ